jgi:pyridoxamine 5'-phosphate oxidase
LNLAPSEQSRAFVPVGDSENREEFIVSIQNLRKQYMRGGLNESEVSSDPWQLFRRWFDEALNNNDVAWFEPNAMTLATSSSDGNVTARIVLLKHFDSDGFVFFTNYESVKGQQLKENAQAALVIYWPHLERQVRVEGNVETVSREMSDQYFHSRPRGSQIGAAISKQSAPLGNRDELEKAAKSLDDQLAGNPIPLPDYWGGYRVVPMKIEFWQGRENRLHDRLSFENRNGNWRIQRLAP